MIHLCNVTEKSATPLPVLYVDLDGVLVDFEAGVRDLTGEAKVKDAIRKIGIDELWNLINARGSDWWATLPWMADGKLLWETLKTKNVQVLSSGTTRNTGNLAYVGKVKWIEQNLGLINSVIVDSSSKKQFYSNPNNLLIDDLHSNITEWKAKNGIAVHHFTSEQSLQELSVIESQHGPKWNKQ